MVRFPNCKINIGLQIKDKRADGFHNLETIFYPIPLRDALEIIPVIESKTEITTTGIVVDAQPEKNICYRAFDLLKADFPELPFCKMHLHKAIPIGAGLGGGSADGSFALQMIRDLFALPLSDEELLPYAAKLGSDCPFFIINKPAFAAGRGEELELVQLDLSAYKILIVNPGIHINTAQAFADLSYNTSDHKDLKKAIAQPIESWQENIVNDFEKGIFASYPAIAQIKTILREKGALYAAMSGTGSTVYGIFPLQKNLGQLIPASYFCKWV